MPFKTQLIKLFLIAISDNDCSPEERQLLYEIGARKDFSPEEIDHLVSNPQLVKTKFPKKLSERVDFVYDLAQMILIDGTIDPRETANFYTICEAMEFCSDKAHGILNVMITGIKNGDARTKLVDDALAMLKTEPVEVEISPAGRIFIGQDKSELRLTPVCRALYIFFLTNEGGCRLTELEEFSDDIRRIYSKVSNRSEPAAIENAIQRIINPMENTFNENKSNINRKIRNSLPPDIQKYYSIEGSRGEKYFIALPRELVSNLTSWHPN